MTAMLTTPFEESWCGRCGAVVKAVRHFCSTAARDPITCHRVEAGTQEGLHGTPMHCAWFQASVALAACLEAPFPAHMPAQWQGRALCMEWGAAAASLQHLCSSLMGSRPRPHVL